SPPDIDDVVADRQMRAVFFQNPDRQHAGALRFLNRLDEIGAGELVPPHRQLLGMRQCGAKQGCSQPSHSARRPAHKSLPPSTQDWEDASNSNATRLGNGKAAPHRAFGRRGGAPFASTASRSIAADRIARALELHYNGSQSFEAA